MTTQETIWISISGIRQLRFLLNASHFDRMWITLVLCLHNSVSQSEAVVDSWTQWPGQGYVGLSVDTLTHSQSLTACQQDGGTILVYESSAELDNIIKSFKNFYTAWVSGSTGTGDCNCVSVIDSVSSSQTSCDDSKSYLCHLPPKQAATTLIETTTRALTTTPPPPPTTTTAAETTTETTTTVKTATETITTAETTTTTTGASISIADLNDSEIVNTTRQTSTQVMVEVDSPSGYVTSANQAPFPGPPALEWNVWIPWTECSVSCNTGTRFRLKLCATDKPESGNCSQTLGSLEDVTISYATDWDMTCNSHPCPLWTAWSAWSDCSATCGRGTTTRHRTCLNEDAGDFECPGERYEVDFCDLEKCPVYVSDERVAEEMFTESDGRPSAIGLGSLSLIFVLIELIIVLILDLATIASHFRYLKRNLAHLRSH